MTASSPVSPFSFFKSLPAKSQEGIRRVKDWSWVATTGFDLAPPLKNCAHDKYVAQRGSTHTPPHREIMLVIESEGEAYFSLEKRSYRRKVGVLFLFDHYEARDYRRSPSLVGKHNHLWLHLPVADNGSLTYNTVTVTGDGQTIREISLRVFPGPAAQLINRAWDQFKLHPDEPLYWEILKSHVTTTVLEVLNSAQVKPTPNQQEQIVAHMRDYISEHCAAELPLQSLARMAGYSPFFFNRIFRKYVGVTPKRFQSNLRLERAKELLKEGLTVAAVAEAVGMDSPFSFSRFFKKETGFSPIDWRELQSGGRRS